MEFLPVQSVQVNQQKQHPTNIVQTDHCQIKEVSEAKESSSQNSAENAVKRVKVDFSIDAILSRTQPSSQSKIVHPQPKCNPEDDPQFSWVYCTRYRPPKLPRAKREVNIRTRYRNPRIPFSTIEVTTLERKFLQSPYLGSNDVNELATILNMSPKRVKIWFQNRRARERRERETQ